MFLSEFCESGISLEFWVSGEVRREILVPIIATYDSEVNLMDLEGAGAPFTVPCASGWCGSDVAEDMLVHLI
jgi:hypothetical protein